MENNEHNFLYKSTGGAPATVASVELQALAIDHQISWDLSTQKRTNRNLVYNQWRVLITAAMHLLMLPADSTDPD